MLFTRSTMSSSVETITSSALHTACAGVARSSLEHAQCELTYAVQGHDARWAALDGFPAPRGLEFFDVLALADHVDRLDAEPLGNADDL